MLLYPGSGRKIPADGRTPVSAGVGRGYAERTALAGRIQGSMPIFGNHAECCQGRRPALACGGYKPCQVTERITDHRSECEEEQKMNDKDRMLYPLECDGEYWYVITVT